MDQHLKDLFSNLTISVRDSKIREDTPRFGPFDHIVYFRSYCRSSSGYDPTTDDVVAGLPKLTDFSKFELKRWVQLHAREENQIPTPFISVTPDPLRAFNRALHLQYNGKEDIYIVVIDAWVLGSANIIDCNRLRRLVGEPELYLFDTEVYVWQRIPSNAIIGCWPWVRICDSLGKIFPPLVELSSIPEDGKRPLQALRDSLENYTPKPTMSDLAKALVNDLGLRHWDLTTKQIAMIMIGWSKGKSRISHYYDLQETLEQSMREDLDELDYRLYVRSCRWYQNHSMSWMPKGTEDLEHMREKWRISRNFIPPTFEEWVAMRLEFEQVVYQEECDLVPPKGNFLPLLEGLGFDVRPITMHRGPVTVTYA